jgi:hypothetical protein
MTLFGVEGVAGSGKTYRLMELLEAHLRLVMLEDHQLALALTFMHGARRRLRDRLRAIKPLHNRFECMTIDSFAQRVLRRWRTLAKARGMPIPSETDFDAQCDGAADLIDIEHVRAWVASRFPIVLLDEAQDLGRGRLRIVSSLAKSVTMFVAGDEFQCLESTLRPSPAIAWLRTACTPEQLTKVHRTKASALLATAQDLRSGKAPTAGTEFKVYAAPSVPLAAAYLANAINWNGGSTIAAITPVLKGGFAYAIVNRVSTMACDKAKKGPHPFLWENSDAEEAASMVRSLTLPWPATLGDLVAALGTAQQSGPIRQTIKWARRQSRVLGKATFERDEIESTIRRQVELRSQYGGRAHQRLLAMTVHQAKNREFEGVVVFWPYTVGGDVEHKRRLLYNAVTRAQRWCAVVVQNSKPPLPPPFS